MSEQQTKTTVVQVAVVTGKLCQRTHVRERPLPFLRETFVILVERGAQRLKEGSNGVVLGVSKSQSKGELAVTA